MGTATGFFGFIIITIIVLLVLTSCIKIIPQVMAMAVERFGTYQGTWSVGLHFKVPLIDRVVKRVILKEQVVDFVPQPAITKDSVTVRIGTVVFFQIADPELLTCDVENPIMAIENLTTTTLCNIISDLGLDQTLTSRETISTKMRTSPDVATDPWGIKVSHMGPKNIISPVVVQGVMEEQMKTERKRHESILRAEGEKKSTILVAEGKRGPVILNTEAEKQSAILRVKAEKEKMIYEAEGQAVAILRVQQANADGIHFLKEAGVDAAVLQMKDLEAFMKVADGKPAKIIIPPEIRNMTGLVTSIAGLAKES